MSKGCIFWKFCPKSADHPISLNSTPPPGSKQKLDSDRNKKKLRKKVLLKHKENLPESRPVNQQEIKKKVGGKSHENKNKEFEEIIQLLISQINKRLEDSIKNLLKQNS